MILFFPLIFLILILTSNILFEQHFLIQQFLTTGSPSDTQMYTAIFLILGFVFLGLAFFQAKIVRIPKTQGLILAVFLAWLVLSSFFSKDTGTSIWQVLLMTAYVCLFLGAYNLLKNNPKFESFLIVSFAAVGSAILLKDLFFYSYSGDLAQGKYFIGSFFWHNQMAGFLLFLVPVFAALSILSKRPAIKFAWFLMLVTAFAAMVLTFSRGGWVSLALTAVLFFAFYLKQQKGRLNPAVFIISLFLLFMIVFFRADLVVNKLSELRADLSGERTVSGNLRTTVWLNGLEMVGKYPVSGVGPGAFGVLYYSFQDVPWLYAKNAHNYFLELAAESGVIGLLLFLLFIFAVLFPVILNRKKFLDITKNPLLIGVFLAILASFVHAFVDVDFSRISLFSIFWVFLAIVTARVAKDEVSFKIQGVKVLVYVPILVLLIVATLFAVGEKFYLDAQRKLAEQDFLGAKRLVDKSINLNPSESRYYFLNGQISEIFKQSDDALKNYEKSIDISPYKIGSFFRTAMIYKKNGNLQSARAWLEKAIILGSFSDPLYYGNLADVYIQLGQPQMAKQVLNEAVYRRFPTDETFEAVEHRYNYTGFRNDLAGLYLRLIELQLKAGQTDEARLLLEILESRVEPQNPQIPDIRRYLDNL